MSALFRTGSVVIGSPAVGTTSTGYANMKLRFEEVGQHL
jgi:hypothetical protein